MTTKYQALAQALNEHGLDGNGNIYTITTEDVLVYINELTNKDSELAGKIDLLDPVSLAVEIADYIGGVGILEHVELAIHEAINLQIKREIETEVNNG
jgi:hypothetical protein